MTDIHPLLNEEKDSTVRLRERERETERETETETETETDRQTDRDRERETETYWSFTHIKWDMGNQRKKYRVVHQRMSVKLVSPFFTLDIF